MDCRASLAMTINWDLTPINKKPTPETFKEPAGSLNIQNNRDLTPIYSFASASRSSAMCTQSTTSPLGW